MSNDVPQWTDEAALGWSPERELSFTPPSPRFGPWSPAPAARDAEPAQVPAARAWPWRIGIGLAQGLLFFLLFRSRAVGQWPGNDPFLFDAIALPALFAPWVLMAGLGRIALSRLLVFAIAVTAILAALGWYQRWRIFGVLHGQPGLSMLLLAGLSLFIAQSFLEARETAGSWRIVYAGLFRAGWTLAARLCLLLLAAGLGLALVHSPLLPRPTLERGDVIAMPLLGLCGALAFQLTAALPRFTMALTAALVASATVALPLGVGAAILLLATSLADGPPPLLFLLAVMALLVAGVSASHPGDGAKHAPWREGLEFFAALLLTALAGLAVWVLAARVAAFGWTSARIFAAAWVALLGAYGLGYSVAAVVGLLRGGGMKGVAAVNIVLGVATMLGALALASPLADPLRLAPWAQAARLEQGRVAVAAFDFANLPRDGARFGNQALAALAHSLYPDIAHAAREVQGAGSDPPNPTEIGANIAVRTQGARLPAALLARDWSQVPEAPPCLTRASERCEAFFLDLNGDHRPEILLVTGGETRWWGAVMQADEAGRWSMAGRLAAGCGATLSDLRAGHFSVLTALPGWNDLQIAGSRLSVMPSGTGCSHY